MEVGFEHYALNNLEQVVAWWSQMLQSCADKTKKNYTDGRDAHLKLHLNSDYLLDLTHPLFSAVLKDLMRHVVY